MAKKHTHPPKHSSAPPDPAFVEQVKATLRAQLQWWDSVQALEAMLPPEHCTKDLPPILDEIAIGIDDVDDVSDTHAEEFLQQLPCAHSPPSSPIYRKECFR